MKWCSCSEYENCCWVLLLQIQVHECQVAEY